MDHTAIITMLDDIWSILNVDNIAYWVVTLLSLLVSWLIVKALFTKEEEN